METNTSFSHWLANKLFLVNLGLYTTIGLLIFTREPLAASLGLPPLITSFSIYFVIMFLRAAYESIIIYEAPVKQLSLHKMLILTTITAASMSLVSVYLRPSIGYFAIPASLGIAMLIVKRVKDALWNPTPRAGFFAKLPEILQRSSLSRYGFYAFLVGITYTAYAKYGFPVPFAIAFFIGMLFEETYNMIALYKQNVTGKAIVGMIVWSALCAFTATMLVIVMLKGAGISGQFSTIISVIIVKCLQPLGSRKLILRV